MGQQVEVALRNSMERVIDVLVGFLPGLLAFLVAVLVLTLVGWLLALIVRRVLTSARFDERMAARERAGSSASLSEFAPSNSPTLLFSRGIFWVCVLAGIAVGLTALNAVYGASAQMSIFLLPYLTHTVGAILIFLIGGLLARFLSRSVLISAVNAQLQYARFLALGVKWLVLVLTAAMALDHLRVGGAIVELAFGILFGGIVLTLALAIGLGSRDLVSRSIGTLEKTIEKPTPLRPVDPTASQTGEAPRSRLRHF
jgi:hypothetical protein